MGQEKSKQKIKRFAVIDIFCGVGGLTHGFYKENFNIVAGIDFDKSCKYAYEVNNKSNFIHKDVSQIKGKELHSLYPKGVTKILVGCAPCQPFSIYTPNDKRKTSDGKWKLLYEFSRLIKEVNPDIVSMENVPQLEKFENGTILNDFILELKKSGFNVTYKIVNAQDYGVPQRRKRLILLASKFGKIDLIYPTHNKSNYITVRKAIGHLSKIEDGEIFKKDRLHYARKLNDKNKLRIKATKEGGGWQDWPQELVLECHKKESGKSFRSVYGRMRWDDVSPTLTTHCIGLGNGRFGHPEQNRAISLREAAIIQSFPENYDFIDNTTSFSPAILARQIGNAVPVELGRVIAKTIKLHLKQFNYG